jgi:hypothetical protein
MTVAALCDILGMSVVRNCPVSTGHQYLDQQHDVLTASGYTRIFISLASIYRALQSAELTALGVSGDAVADGVRVGS